MADVFISYSREDRGKAKVVADALETEGFTVWWDRRLVGGSDFVDEIEKQLLAAVAVVVLWSKSAIGSPWVRDEASKGRDYGKLVPARLDDAEAPLGFGQYHTIDLTGRRWKKGAKGVEELVEATRRRIADQAEYSPTLLNEPEAWAGTQNTKGPILVGAGVIAAIGAAMALFLGDLFPNGTPTSETLVSIGKFEVIGEDSRSGEIASLTRPAIERVLATNFINTIDTEAIGSKDAETDIAVSGFVDRDGEDYRLSVDLISPREGRILWSTRLSRPVEDARRLPDEMGLWLGDVLRCTTYLRNRMIAYDSVELLSRTLRFCEAERGRGERLGELPALARALIEIAPESSYAWSTLGNALSLDPQVDPQLVYDAAHKAFELDPENGALYYGPSSVADPKVSIAQRIALLEKGVAIEPEFGWNISNLAHYMATVGRTRDSVRLFRKYVDENPLDYHIRDFFASQLAAVGDVGAAREQFDLIHRERPGLDRLWYSRMRAEAHVGDPNRAIESIEREGLTGSELACAGLMASARASGPRPSEASLKSACDRGGWPLAEIYMLYGYNDRALDVMHDNVREEGWIPRFGPRYTFYKTAAGLRKDRRIIHNLAHLGIPQYWLETGEFADFCSEDDLPYDCREAAQEAIAQVAAEARL